MSSYKCSTCGQIHEGWPALAFNSPFHYDNLSEVDKENIAELSDDFCIIRHKEQTDRFIRVILKQQVKDHCQVLEYGVWVSLSETNFNEHFDNFKNHGAPKTYFGYLCNNIPEYENTIDVKTNVVTGEGEMRPEIFPHDDQMDNAFVRDYYEGITKAEAERRIHTLVQGR